MEKKQERIVRCDEGEIRYLLERKRVKPESAGSPGRKSICFGKSGGSGPDGGRICKEQGAVHPLRTAAVS